MQKRKQLLNDLREITHKANTKGYIFQHSDAFAIGYLAAKYNLTKLIDNQDAVVDACVEYDETDDLALMDTIGETLIDLKIINNDKKTL